MLLCWDCKSGATIFADAWVCPHCGRHSDYDGNPAETWSQGAMLNLPYRDDKK